MSKHFQQAHRKTLLKADRVLGKLKPSSPLESWGFFFFFSSWGGSSSPNSGLVSMKKDKMADRPSTVMWTCPHPALNLLGWSISRDPTGQRKSPKVFVLQCQAFVSGQEGEEASHLGSSPSLISSSGPSPYLSAYQKNSLTPTPSLQPQGVGRHLIAIWIHEAKNLASVSM